VLFRRLGSARAFHGDLRWYRLVGPDEFDLATDYISMDFAARAADCSANVSSDEITVPLPSGGGHRDHRRRSVRAGACLSSPREPRWLERERMQGARRRPWWLPRASRATPQTPLSQPTLRDRADFPSCGVVASLLGYLPNCVGSALPEGEICRGRGHAENSDRLLHHPNVLELPRIGQVQIFAEEFAALMQRCPIVYSPTTEPR